MNPALRLGATGFGLIAVCYGFARFAFGLFLPEVRADLDFSSTLGGVISGGSFMAYCLAIVLSAWLSERVGARAVAVAAALVAAVGMAGIALAPSAFWLAAAVMLAGSSTGLASPPMAAAVARAVRSERQDLTNTAINAGTSAGVALSGPIALAMGQDWRLVFAIFAATALVMAVAAFVALPRHTAGGASQNGSGLPRISANLARLIGASFLMGASSTALWSFGGELAAARLGWSSAGIGLLWIAMGAAGIVGAGAGALVARFGLNIVHWVFLAMLAASILAVGLPLTTPALTLAGGALFGAAYVMLTGVYLVWGISALSERPATGLMVGFLTIAVGQTAGAPVFGLLMGHRSPAVAAASFAVLGLVAGALRWQVADREAPAAARAPA